MKKGDEEKKIKIKKRSKEFIIEGIIPTPDMIKAMKGITLIPFAFRGEYNNPWIKENEYNNKTNMSNL